MNLNYRKIVKNDFLLVIFSFFVGINFLPAQSIDRSIYTDIDPYDYALSIRQVTNGAVRQYKSTVTFSMQSGTTYYFYSLDGNTMLSLETSRRFNTMTRNQRVTIYYTATKNQYVSVDSLVLDDIDYENATAGPNTNPANNSSQTSVVIDRTAYQEIDPFDYQLSIRQVTNGAVRQYKSTVTFSMQSGTTYYFYSLDGNTMLSLEASRRFNTMTRNQRVTIYYTATKNQYVNVDSLALDDIDY